jgi:glyoxylase-like metal-dependent hydrolase (beta-lactamase superfamily II)
MAVEIESADERLLFLADTILHPLDAEYPDTRAVVDHRPEEMVATRRSLLDRAATDRTLVMGSHLPFPGLGYLTPRGAAWVWKPI